MGSELTIRPAAPEEAAEIGALVRLQYGLLNADAVLYDAAALAQDMRAGNYHFIAATDGDGKAAGVICVKPARFKGCAEIGTLTVRPECRGKGLGKALLAAALRAVPLVRGHTAFYYYALTVDTMTQKWGCDNGLVPCGLAANRFKFDRAAANLAGSDPPERRTHLIMAKAAKKRDAGFLHVPGELEEYARGVYADLGVRSRKVCRPREETAIFDYPAHDYADIVGGLPDNPPRRESLNLFLNMNDAACPERYGRAREAGFMFTGVQPLAESGEYLVMHRSPGGAAAIAGARTETRFDGRKRFILSLRT